MHNLAIRVERFRAAKAATVRCRGTLDANTSERLQQTVAALLEEGFLNLVLDLKQVDYISSIGMGVLIESKSAAEKQGGEFLLQSPSLAVKDIFSVMGFGSLFLIVRSDKEAFGYFGISEKIPKDKQP